MVRNESSEPLAAPVTPKKKTSTEPLTISLKTEVLRKARILAASRGVKMSKLIAELLAEAVGRELPAVAARLQDPNGVGQ